MSNVVNTSKAALSLGEDRPRSVPVTIGGISAVRAPEDSFGQPEARLSLATLRAGHGGVRRRHQHHRSARPCAVLDQSPLRAANGGVGGLSRHPGFGQELAPQVFHRNHLVVVDNRLRPRSSGVSVLPCCLFAQPSDLEFRVLVPLRGCPSAGFLATRHLPLCLCKLGGAALPVTGVGQVVRRVSGNRRSGDTPIDAYAAGDLIEGVALAPNNERGVPVTQRVLVDPNRRRGGRQLTGPDDRDAHPVREPQAAFTDREAALGVLQAGKRCLAFLERWACATLHLEGILERATVIPESLLLGNLGAIPEPGEFTACSGEQFRQSTEGGALAGLLLVDGLVPEEPATVPLCGQCSLRLCAGAQTEVVPHCLVHTFYNTWLNVRLLSRWMSTAAGRRDCYSGNIRTSSPSCRRSGPTRNSSPLSAARPWRSSSAMSRTNATSKPHPYLPTAQARGFAGTAK